MKRLCKLFIIVAIMLTFSGCSWNEDSRDPSLGEAQGSTGGGEVTYQVEEGDLNLNQNNITAYTKQNGILYFLGYIGDNATKQLNYSLMTFDENGGLQQEAAISGLNHYMVTEAAIDTKQSLWVLANNISSMQSSDGSDAMSYLVQIDVNGTVLKEQSLNDLTNQSTQYSHLLSDNQGSIFLLGKTQSGEGQILVFDETGEMQKAIPVSQQTVGLFFVDGKTAYTYEITDDGTVQIYEVQKDTGVINQEGISLSITGMKKIFGGMDDSVFVATEDGLWKCYLDGREAVELFRWLDKGIDFNEWNSFQAISENKIIGVSQGVADLKLLQITQEQSSSNEEFVILTLASLQADDALKNEIVVFNQNHDRCAIKLKQYYDPYATGATVEDALERLNADLLSGNAGDLLDMKSLSMTTSPRFYIKRGILENLYDWMDEGVNQDDYTKEVWKANEVDGKLYSLIPSFKLNTMMGRTSQVGNGFSWTPKQMQELIDQYPKMGLYCFETKESFLQYVCQYNMDEFVNWETGDCDFSGDSFGIFLEYAKTLPDSAQEDLDALNEIYSGNVLIEDQLVIDATLSDFLITKQVFGEPVSLMGFPVTDGIGAVFDPEISLAICTQSLQKEDAWEALDYFISEEYQNDLVNRDYRSGLPIMKQARQMIYQKIMEDETQAKSEIGNAYGGWNFEFGYPTEQEIEQLEALIHATTKIKGMDQTIYQIILEETAAYFSDQRNLQEVIDLIQNRISLYIKESM